MGSTQTCDSSLWEKSVLYNHVSDIQHGYTRYYLMIIQQIKREKKKKKIPSHKGGIQNTSKSTPNKRHIYIYITNIKNKNLPMTSMRIL